MRYSSRWIDESDMMVTLHIEKKWFIPWSKYREDQYIGSGTVWHKYPQFIRAPLDMEVWLSDVYRRERFNKKHSEVK